MASFLYTGVDRESLELSHLLQNLGGGDARVSNVETHVIIDDRREKDEQTLWHYGDTIGLRNLHNLSKSAPSSESMAYYNVTSGNILSSILENPSNTNNDNNNFSVVNDAIDWLKAGFNTCIINYGERSSGKTLCMFGIHDKLTDDGRQYANETHNDKWPERTASIAGSIIQNLFKSLSSSIEKDEWSIMPTVAISCYCMKGNDIIDLCAGTSDGSTALEFALVNCPDSETTELILMAARDRAIGCLARATSLKDDQRVHFFCRLVLHGQSRGKPPQLSHIHLVDLIGTGGPFTNPTSKYHPPSVACHNPGASRTIALQLGTLVKVMSEMREASRKASAPFQAPSEQPKLKVTSARESRLTALLAPLIQGNARTVMLIHVKDGANHYMQTRNTLGSFKGIKDITNALFVGDAPMSMPPTVAPNTVLPVPVDHSLHHDVVSKYTDNHHNNYNYNNHTSFPLSQFSQQPQQQSGTGKRVTYSLPNSVSLIGDDDDNDDDDDDDVGVTNDYDGHAGKNMNGNFNNNYNNNAAKDNRKISQGDVDYEVDKENVNWKEMDHGQMNKTPTTDGRMSKLMSQFKELLAEVEGPDSPLRNTVSDSMNVPHRQQSSSPFRIQQHTTATEEDIQPGFVHDQDSEQKQNVEKMFVDSNPFSTATATATANTAATTSGMPSNQEPLRYRNPFSPSHSKSPMRLSESADSKRGSSIFSPPNLKKSVVNVNVSDSQHRTPIPMGYPAGYSGTTPDPLIVPSSFFDSNNYNVDSASDATVEKIHVESETVSALRKELQRVYDELVDTQTRASHKLQVMESQLFEQKQLTKQLKSNSGLVQSGVLSQLNEDVFRLTQDNENLRDRCLELELRKLPRGDEGGEAIAEICKRTRHLHKAQQDWRREVYSLKTQLRQKDVNLASTRGHLSQIELEVSGMRKERSRLLQQVLALKQRVKFAEGQRATFAFGSNSSAFDRNSGVEIDAKVDVTRKIIDKNVPSSHGMNGNSMNTSNINNGTKKTIPINRNYDHLNKKTTVIHQRQPQNINRDISVANRANRANHSVRPNNITGRGVSSSASGVNNERAASPGAPVMHDIRKGGTSKTIERWTLLQNSLHKRKQLSNQKDDIGLNEGEELQQEHQSPGKGQQILVTEDGKSPGKAASTGTTSKASTNLGSPRLLKMPQVSTHIGSHDHDEWMARGQQLSGVEWISHGNEYKSENERMEIEANNGSNLSDNYSNSNSNSNGSNSSNSSNYNSREEKSRVKSKALEELIAGAANTAPSLLPLMRLVSENVDPTLFEIPEDGKRSYEDDFGHPSAIPLQLAPDPSQYPVIQSPSNGNKHAPPLPLEATDVFIGQSTRSKV